MKPLDRLPLSSPLVRRMWRALGHETYYKYDECGPYARLRVKISGGTYEIRTLWREELARLGWRRQYD